MQNQDDALLAVEQLFNNYEENYNSLIQNKEISFATDYKNQFTKVILLACASYFETKVVSAVIDSLNTQSCSLTYNFVSRKALKRQYHTLFNWDSRNANSFFSFFGEDFKKFMVKRVKEDEKLKSSIQDFLLLGSLRNQLVHDNYAMFSLELTVEDMWLKFKNAQQFVFNIKNMTNDFKCTT